MSCPYLEKGIVARCRAFGKIGLRIDAREEETDCFSGDFSDCSLLSNTHSPKPSKGSTPKAWRSPKQIMPEGGRLEPYLAGTR
jgi:hypothetical protein